MRADTRVTPYSKIRLKTYAQLVLPFGKLVLARRPGTHLQQSQTQFVYGCWLGRESHTDEHTVGSKARVFRTRTVRRLTEDRSWSTEAVADMEWTPWRTAATTRGRPPTAAVGERNEPIWNALQRTTHEIRSTGCQKHVGQTRGSGGTTPGLRR